MASKRKSTNAGSSPSKRLRSSPPNGDITIDGNRQPSGYEIRSRLDPTCGQRGAFPGLDVADGDDELFYGPASDGLEYLRMVRSEAKTVPTLLVAPPSDQADNERTITDHTGGYYFDGAYIAAPVPSSADDSMDTVPRSTNDDDSDIDPQEAYYCALLVRFADLRADLAAAASTRTSPDPGLSDGTSIGRRKHQWERTFCRALPTPLHVGSLSQEDVICGLQRIAYLLTGRNLLGETCGNSLGTWVWSLLGKCRDVGEMGSEEVAVLRELGKRALTLGRKLRAKGGVMDMDDGSESEMIDEEEVDESVTDHSSDCPSAEDGYDLENRGDTLGQPLAKDEAPLDMVASTPSVEQENIPELEIARRRLLDAVGSEQINISSDQTGTTFSKGQDSDSTRVKALATLDIIVTIVGEMYGQRDLLDHRAVWCP